MVLFSPDASVLFKNLMDSKTETNHVPQVNDIIDAEISHTPIPAQAQSTPARWSPDLLNMDQAGKRAYLLTKLDPTFPPDSGSEQLGYLPGRRLRGEIAGEALPSRQCTMALHETTLGAGTPVVLKTMQDGMRKDWPILVAEIIQEVHTRPALVAGDGAGHLTYWHKVKITHHIDRLVYQNFVTCSGAQPLRMASRPGTGAQINELLARQAAAVATVDAGCELPNEQASVAADGGANYPNKQA